MSLLGLSGDSINADKKPETCPRCGETHFYMQHDFKRSLGVGIVTVASVISFALMGMGFDWLIFMSPMIVALVVDRAFSASRPFAAICYKCGLIFRQIPKDEVLQLEEFDLELYDRIHYAERTQGESPID